MNSISFYNTTPTPIVWLLPGQSSSLLLSALATRCAPFLLTACPYEAVFIMAIMDERGRETRKRASLSTNARWCDTGHVTMNYPFSVPHSFLSSILHFQTTSYHLGSPRTTLNLTFHVYEKGALREAEAALSMSSKPQKFSRNLFG